MIRPTYANVVSTIALALALSGTSYAAVHLGKNAVKGPNIAPNAVTSTKVKDGSLLSKDIKAGQFLPGVIVRHTQRAEVASLDTTPFEVAGIGPPGLYSGSYSTALVQPADWNYMAVNAQVHVTVTAGTNVTCSLERRINGGAWTEIAAAAVPDSEPRQGYMTASFPWFTPNSIIDFRVLCATGTGTGTLTGAEIGVEAGRIA